MKVSTRKQVRRALSVVAAATLAALAPAKSVFASPIAIFSGDGNANDSSGYHNNGTFAGNYTDHAFNLATGSFSANAIPAYNLGQYSGFTVGFWFNYNSTTPSSSNGTFLGQDQGPGELPKFFIDYNYPSYSTFVFHVNNYGSNPRVFLTSNELSAPGTGWHQLIVTRNPSSVSFYLDGHGVGSAAYSGIVPNVAAPLTAGVVEPCCGFHGLLSNIVIDSTAWSPTQVKASFDLGRVSPVPEASTAAMWLIGVAALAITFARRRTEQAGYP